MDKGGAPNSSGIDSNNIATVHIALFSQIVHSAQDVGLQVQLTMMSFSPFQISLCWAVLSAILFGLCSYLILVLEKIPGVSSNVKLGMIWSYCGTIVVVPFALKSRNPWFEHYPDHLRRRTIGVAISMLGGISMGFSFVCLQNAFAIDPRNAAPLQAVVAADVIVFAIYCHFVYNEKLNSIQWFSVILLVVSIAVMSLGASTDASDDIEEVSTERHQDAIVWAFGGMCCFFLLNITLRLRFTFPITPSGDFSFRMLTVGAMGLVTLTVSAYTGSFQKEMLPLSARTWHLWGLSLAVAFLQGLGTSAVVQAFKHPASSNITVAIMGCGCIVVLVLEVVFDRVLPGMWQLAGMALAVVSVMLMSLSGRDYSHPCSDAVSSPVSSPVSPPYGAF